MPSAVSIFLRLGPRQILMTRVFSQTFTAAVKAFQDALPPSVKTSCVPYPNSTKTEGEPDRTPYSSEEAVAKGYRRWKYLVTFFNNEEMLPPGNGRSPDEQKCWEHCES